MRHETKRIDAIFFDWDGTLIDTAAPAFAAFQKAFQELGISITAEIYEKIYSPNWYSMYQALDLPKRQWQEAEDLWTKHYASESISMVENGRSILNELRLEGYCLGLVTSGSRPRVLRELGQFGLSHLFYAVVCNEDVIKKKPHPEGLNAAMNRLGKSAAACCYIGDSADDIEMGKRAGVCAVGVLSKYPNSNKLLEAGPDFYFENLSQLLKYILGHWKAGL